MDGSFSQNLKERFEVVKVVFPERVSEIIFEESGVFKVPTSSSQDRMLQSIREQFLDVPVPRVIKQFVDVPKIVFQDRMWQRTFEQLADIPVLQAVEEPVLEVFSQDRVQQHCGEQETEVPKISCKAKSCSALVRFSMFSCRWWKCRRWCLMTESSDELPSRLSTGQSSRISLRTGFNSVSLSRTLKNPVPQMPEQLGEVPNMVSPIRIQRRTARQIVDVPVPQGGERTR